MKRLPSIIFLLLCFGLGLVLAMAYQHAPGTSKEAATGIGIGNAPPLRGFSLPRSANKSLFDLFPPIHATAVAIEYPDDPATLANFSYHAHKLDLKVVLLPGAQADASGHGENPFPHPLAAIAAQAQAAGVDVLCVSWLDTDPDPAFWLAQIVQVRKNFSGRIILAATPDLLPGIEFLDQADLIGAIGPFDLPIRGASHSGNVNLRDLRTAWACSLDSLESLSFRYGKRLVLLNIAVPPAAPSDVGGENRTPDFPQLVYEGLVTETKGRAGTEGLFMRWLPDAPAIHEGDTSNPTFVNQSPPLLARIAELWLPTSPVIATTDPEPTPDDEADTDP